MKTVILDTNFLLIPHQFKIDIFARLERLLEEHHQFVISSAIMGELKGLAHSRGKDGVAARVALLGVEKYKDKIKLIETEERDADKWITEYCMANPKTIVCTNDIGLRVKLKAMRIRIIVMRTRTSIFWA